MQADEIRIVDKHGKDIMHINDKVDILSEDFRKRIEEKIDETKEQK